MLECNYSDKQEYCNKQLDSRLLIPFRIVTGSVLSKLLNLSKLSEEKLLNMHL